MIEETSDLREHRTKLDSFDWTLVTTYRVTDEGRRARGAVRAMGSDCYELDDGEAPSVELLAVEIEKDGAPTFPVPLAALSADDLAELESEIVAKLCEDDL